MKYSNNSHYTSKEFEYYVLEDKIFRIEHYRGGTAICIVNSIPDDALLSHEFDDLLAKGILYSYHEQLPGTIRFIYKGVDYIETLKWEQLVNGDKSDFVHFQVSSILSLETPQPAVKCRCGRKIVVWKMYRCYYCGEYYCEQCAPEHFGMTRAEYKEQEFIKTIKPGDFVRNTNCSYVVGQVYATDEEDKLRVHWLGEYYVDHEAPDWDWIDLEKITEEQVKSILEEEERERLGPYLTE
jgi:hypothetical protein